MPIESAYRALDGLSVGDALGAQFFMVGRSLSALIAGNPPTGPWEWTDDTEMACNLITELRDHGAVEQDRLAMTFADRCEPYRGYGAGAFVILHKIRKGVPWREAAGPAFNGSGSCGNGAAMRVAPLGAYFADDLDKVVEQATLSISTLRGLSVRSLLPVPRRLPAHPGRSLEISSNGCWTV